MKLTAFMTTTIENTVRVKLTQLEPTASAADRQRVDLQLPEPRDDAGGEELGAELDHPVEVPQVVGDADAAR